MYTLKELQFNGKEPQAYAEINGKWVPARPYVDTNLRFSERLKDAIKVLTGKADAFTWPEGQ